MEMITDWFSPEAAIGVLVLGLAGCVAYESAPYYAPAYDYSARTRT
jgi:hypothetical protein